jgi:hypothetical protein
MANIDDAIFLMDDEVIVHSPVKKIKNSNKKDTKKSNKKEKYISMSLTDETTILPKSPPIAIIKPQKIECKKSNDIVPSSPFINKRFSAPAIL